MDDLIEVGKLTRPERIRVAQDADGFWTCREAVSGSPEYVRSDAHEALVKALEAVAEARMPGEARRIARAALRDRSAP